MKGGGETKRAARARLLTREELALWRHATADVKPHDAKRVPAPDVPALAPSAPGKASAPVLLPPGPPPAETAKRSSALPPLAPLEKRLKRRLGSGKTQVDDVLDLHGMTQAQAHRALNNFLWRSAENGAKLILVITGKGSSAAEGAGVTERGVLRRNAPHWLRAPEMRAIVLSVEEAARPHGGAGALYVRLRRRVPS